MITDLHQAERHIVGLQDAVRYFAADFLGLRREVLRVAHLDGTGAILAMRTHRSGQCDAIDFPLRRIAADALGLGSRALIVAHNHPSGDPSPSPNDLDATRALLAVARPLGIRLQDHLIFADSEYRSLWAMGLL